MEVKFKISIVCMDNECKHSVKYVSVKTCTTWKSIDNAIYKAIRDIRAGKYEKPLKGIKYVYVNAIPYSMDGECLLGMEYDYMSEYYERKNDEWCMKLSILPLSTQQKTITNY